MRLPKHYQTENRQCFCIYEVSIACFPSMSRKSGQSISDFKTCPDCEVEYHSSVKHSCTQPYVAGARDVAEPGSWQERINAATMRFQSLPPTLRVPMNPLRESDGSTNFSAESNQASSNEPSRASARYSPSRSSATPEPSALDLLQKMYGSSPSEPWTPASVGNAERSRSASRRRSVSMSGRSDGSPPSVPQNYSSEEEMVYLGRYRSPGEEESDSDIEAGPSMRQMSLRSPGHVFPSRMASERPSKSPSPFVESRASAGASQSLPPSPEKMPRLAAARTQPPRSQSRAPEQIMGSPHSPHSTDPRRASPMVFSLPGGLPPASPKRPREEESGSSGGSSPQRLRRRVKNVTKTAEELEKARRLREAIGSSSDENDDGAVEEEEEAVVEEEAVEEEAVEEEAVEEEAVEEHNGAENDDDAAEEPELSAYELERRQNMQRNKELMLALGIGVPSASDLLQKPSSTGRGRGRPRGRTVVGQRTRETLARDAKKTRKDNASTGSPEKPRRPNGSRGSQQRDRGIPAQIIPESENYYNINSNTNTNTTTFINRNTNATTHTNPSTNIQPASMLQTEWANILDSDRPWAAFFPPVPPNRQITKASMQAHVDTLEHPIDANIQPMNGSFQIYWKPFFVVPRPFVPSSQRAPTAPQSDVSGYAGRLLANMRRS